MRESPDSLWIIRGLVLSSIFYMACSTPDTRIPRPVGSSNSKYGAPPANPEAQSTDQETNTVPETTQPSDQPDQTEDSDSSLPTPPLSISFSLSATNVSTSGESFFGRGTRLADGSLVLSYGQDIDNSHTVKTEISKDDGKTWQALGEIISQPFVDGVGGIGTPNIAVLPSGTLLAVYHNAEVDGTFHLQSSASVDGGRTWTVRGDIDVTTDIGASGSQATLLVNSKGQAQAYYTKGKNPTGGELEVVMKTSTDEGRTWGNQITVASRPVGNSGFPAPVRLKDGSILVAFDTFRGDNDSRLVIRSVQSNNDGLTWTSPQDVYIPVNGDKNAQTPQITILPDGRPIVMFMTNEGDGVDACCVIKVMVSKDVASFNKLEWQPQAVVALPSKALVPSAIPTSDGNFLLVYERARDAGNNIRKVQMLRTTVKGGL